MQPHQLRKRVRRWTIPVVACTVLGAGVAFLVSRALTPIYEAKGAVLVLAGPGQTANVNLNLNAQDITTTAATLLAEPPLLQQVINANHLNESVDTLAKQLSVTPQNNSQVVDVLVRDPSATRAAAIDNALMNAYVAQVTKRNTDRITQAGAALQAQINQVAARISQAQDQLASAQRSGQDTTALRATINDENSILSQLTLNYSSFKATQSQDQETVSVAAPAATPLTPASPQKVLNTALGALGGLAVGLGLGWLSATRADVSDEAPLASVVYGPRWPPRPSRGPAEVRAEMDVGQRVDHLTAEIAALREELHIARRPPSGRTGG